MDGLQGAILSVKLRHLDRWLERRSKVAQRYQQGLDGVGDLVLPMVRSGVRHVFHLYVVRTNVRDGLQHHLKLRGIDTGIHYPIALPKLAAYAYCGQANEDLFANRTDRELLSLPIGEHMEIKDADEVIGACGEYFQSL